MVQRGNHAENAKNRFGTLLDVRGVQVAHRLNQGGTEMTHMLYISVGLDAPKFDYSFEVKLPYMYENEKEVKSEDFVFYMTGLGIAVCLKTVKGKACANPNLIPFDPEFVEIQGIVGSNEEYSNLSIFKVEREQSSINSNPFDEIDVNTVNALCKNVRTKKPLTEIMNEYKAMGYTRPFIQCRLTAVMFHKVDRSFHPELFIDTDELSKMVEAFKTTLLNKMEKTLKLP